MAIDSTVEMTLEELKTIIHGLRMSTFSFVEDNALNEIQSMIKSLPLPEEIDKMATIPNSIRHLQSDIGNIMRLIELYGRRDIEFKTRYKSRTGLPPRYKVLDWKENMKQNARVFTRELIKTSSAMEEIGCGDISGKMLKIAKKTLSNEFSEFSEVEFAKITADTLEKVGFIKEANEIRKVAQTYDLTMDDVAGGLNQLYQTINGVISSLQKKSEQLINVPSAKNVVKMIGNLWGQLTQFQQSIQKPIQAIQQAAPQISQAMEAAVPTSIFDPATRKTLKIEWTKPDAKGEETAYVIKADGKKYEVQRLQNGQLATSDKPMEEAMLPVQPQVRPTVPETSSSGVAPRGKTQTTGQSTLENLDRNNLLKMIQQYVPEIAQKGYKGQMVANLNDQQLRQVLKESIGEKSLPKLIQYLPKAASTFNLKMHKLACKNCGK